MLDDREEVRIPDPATAEGLPTPNLYCVSFDLLVRGEPDAMVLLDEATRDVEELDPEVPLERSDETLVEERVETRRGTGNWCCLLGPTSGDIFDLRKH